MLANRLYQNKNKSYQSKLAEKKNQNNIMNFSWNKIAFSCFFSLTIFVFVAKFLVLSQNFFLAKLPFLLGLGGTFVEANEASPTPSKETKSNEEKDKFLGESELLKLSAKNSISTLYQLNTRRKEIEAKERELETKEKQNIVIKEEIEKKLNELKQTEKNIKQSIGLIDEKEKENLLKLVKIYESMVAKEAARIFNGLESTLVKKLIDLMSKRKIALILSYMDSKRAKDITSMFAQQENQFKA